MYTVIVAAAYLVFLFFVSNFDMIQMEIQERKAFNEDINLLVINDEYLLYLYVFFGICNGLIIVHQYDWQILIDKSWGSLNFYARSENENQALK